ncbi:hypothetical protein FRC00_004405, partial [Tulasnella sp. 408]
WFLTRSDEFHAESLGRLASLLAANQAAMLQQQQGYQHPRQQYQRSQQLKHTLELYLALANMYLAPDADQMCNTPSDSQL